MMPEIEIRDLLGSDISDPLSGERFTSAVIHDGPNSLFLRVASRASGIGERVSYRDGMADFASKLIAEAYRLGKEAR